MEQGEEANREEIQGVVVADAVAIDDEEGVVALDDQEGVMDLDEDGSDNNDDDVEAMDAEDNADEDEADDDDFDGNHFSVLLLLGHDYYVKWRDLSKNPDQRMMDIGGPKVATHPLYPQLLNHFDNHDKIWDEIVLSGDLRDDAQVFSTLMNRSIMNTKSLSLFGMHEEVFFETLRDGLISPMTHLLEELDLNVRVAVTITRPPAYPTALPQQRHGI